MNCDELKQWVKENFISKDSCNDKMHEQTQELTQMHIELVAIKQLQKTIVAIATAVGIPALLAIGKYILGI